MNILKKLFPSQNSIKEFEVRFAEIERKIECIYNILNTSDIGNNLSDDLEDYLPAEAVVFDWINANPIYKKPISFIFDDKKYLSNSWIKLYENVLIIFLDKYQNRIKNLLSSQMQGSSRKYFSTNPDDMNKPKYLGDGIYYEANLSANAVLNNLKNVFQLFEEDCAILKVFISEKYNPKQRVVKNKEAFYEYIPSERTYKGNI